MTKSELKVVNYIMYQCNKNLVYICIIYKQLYSYVLVN